MSAADLQVVRLLGGLRPPSRAELDPGARRAEESGRPCGDLAELRLDLRPLEEDRRDLGGESGLALLLLGFRGAPPRSRGKPADAHRRDQVHRERDPVLGVRKAERVPRRQKEPVEREHAHDRDRGCEGEPPESRDREDREQVEDAEAQHRGDRLQRVDRPRHERDRGEACACRNGTAPPDRHPAQSIGSGTS